MIHKDVSMSFWNSYKSVMLYSVFHYAQIVLLKKRDPGEEICVNIFCNIHELFWLEAAFLHSKHICIMSHAPVDLCQMGFIQKVLL